MFVTGRALKCYVYQVGYSAVGEMVLSPLVL